ncbi:MAG: hypothetical protein AB8H86_23635 [Polyangiales bacterium]
MVVKFAAAVPLGHQVEVVWYQVVKDGWSGVKIEEFAYLPQITDLDTGIEYLNAHLVADTGSWRTMEPRSVSDDINAPFEVQRVLRGKVRRCRLITIGNYEIGIQTHLDIEPETDQSAYR